jgi:excisionase family DNA binding protein
MTMTKRKPSADSEDYRWRTVKETAEYLKCSRRTVFELRREGRLEFVKFANRNYVTERSLQKLMAGIFNQNGTDET